MTGLLSGPVTKSLSVDMVIAQPSSGGCSTGGVTAMRVP